MHRKKKKHNIKSQQQINGAGAAARAADSHADESTNEGNNKTCNGKNELDFPRGYDYGALVVMAMTALTALFTFQANCINQRGQRAWVGINTETPIVFTVDQVSGAVFFKVPFVNSGQTPATDVRATVGVLSGPPDTELPSEMLKLADAAKQSRGVLMAGQEISIEKLSSQMPIEDLNQLKSGQRRLYLMGEITYQHEWGPGVTQFCQFWAVDIPLSEPLSFCPTFNNAK